MSLWVLLAIVGAIKLVVAALMLWLPLRSDSAMSALQDESRADSEEDDGGSKVPPKPPLDPHPRLPLPHGPRRGPHGSPSPPSPARVRSDGWRVVARTLKQDWRSSP